MFGKNGGSNGGSLVGLECRACKEDWPFDMIHCGGLLGCRLQLWFPCCQIVMASDGRCPPKKGLFSVWSRVRCYLRFSLCSLFIYRFGSVFAVDSRPLLHLLGRSESGCLSSGADVEPATARNSVLC